MEKADRLLVDNGLAASRTQAQKFIAEGKVQVLHARNWQTVYPVVESSIRSCLEEQGLKTTDYFDSPIKGGDGNREFLIIARKASSA
ncbi:MULTISPECIES: hypothetical protein [unclassified Endozoicomonas]|uniref:hypothetical protein n=1 Tax=unclassified Endozoicomonas TaxID=2644528 RepID=UPI003BB7D330